MHSIRWRLVAAFCVTAIVSLAAVGGLSLWLAHGLAARRAAEDLRGNAAAVAAQAAPLVALPGTEPALVELARTSAIVGSTRVRILDPAGEVLADSGPWDADQMVWLDGLSLPAAPEALAPPGSAGGESIVSRVKILRRSHGHGGPVFSFADAGATAATDTEGPWQMILGADGALGALPQVARTTDAQSGGAGSTRTAGGAAADLGPVPGTAETTIDGASRTRVLALAHRLPVSTETTSVRAPIGRPDAPAGYVELSGGPDVAGQVVATAAPAVGVAALTALLLACGLALVFSRSLTAPLAELGAAAKRMESGDLTARAPTSGTRELAALSGNFNRMAASLEQTVADLEEERDALRRFVADASHQLRTPITALATYFELLARDPPPAASDRAEFIADGADQVDRLAWITKNLLDLSRLNAGLAALEPRRVAVTELLDTAVAGARGRATAQGVTLAVVAPDVDLWCHVDPARIVLALGNLLDNALAHTPPGGAVALRAAAVPGAPRVRIEVADTGAGIDPADLPHVFDRFYRGAGAPAGGAGLGLAVVRAIVEAHGGTVAAASIPGEGTTLVLELPGAGDRGGLAHAEGP